MQTSQDLKLNPEQAPTVALQEGGDVAPAPVADAPADTGHMDTAITTAQPVASATEPEPAVVGPVNAAEALALALVQRTFSSPRKLTGPDGAELVVDPEQNAYYFESTALKGLAALLASPASAWTPVYSEAVKAARANHPAQPLERLRWYAGLIATPGILNRKLSRDEGYKLARWPETEREFPKHFRIAKEMFRASATPDAIATASGMSYDDVVDYINASFAAGRLEAKVPVPTAAPELAPTSRRERLIAVLNKPLFVH